MSAVAPTSPLEDDQLRAQQNFARALAERPRQLILDYRSRWGTVCSPLLAGQLAPDYDTSPHTQARLARALAVPSDELVRLVWQKLMAEAAESDAKQGTVLVVAGPTGSGKEALITGLDRQIIERTDAVLFTTLADALYVHRRIEEALAASEQVVVAYLHRGIELCARLTLRQAADTGRVVSLEELAHIHHRSEGGILWLNQRLRRTKDVTVGVVEADLGLGEIRKGTVGAVERGRLTLGRTLELAREAWANEYARQEWHDRRLHDEVFKAFTGGEPPARVRGLTEIGYGELQIDPGSIDPGTLTLARPAAGREEALTTPEPERTPEHDREDEDYHTPRRSSSPYRGR